MDVLESLQSIGEASLTFMGLAAVFNAFSRKDAGDSHSPNRISVVVEGGLILTIACFVPVVFMSIGLEDPWPWRIGSLLGVFFGIRATYMAVTDSVKPGNTPYLLVIAMTLDVTTAVTFLVCVFGTAEWPIASLYLAGVLQMLGFVGVSFIGQFRVEQTEEPGARRINDDSSLWKSDRDTWGKESGLMQRPGINFAQKLTLIQDYWSPKVVAALNDYQVKLAKLKGEFVWHQHDQTDELFICLSGRLRIEMHDASVVLNEGELFVVPKGVPHKPIAEQECHVMIIEPGGVKNTGETESHLTAPNDEWI